MKKRVQQIRKLFFTFACFLFLLVVARATPLNGIYTINADSAASTTNFQTIKAAIDSLIANGVDGHVMFNIASGIYTEQMLIPAISGASDTSTVTFQSAANHADSVILNYAAGANIPIITLAGTSYINLKYITVASTTTTGRGIELSGIASYDSIIYCKIIANIGIYARPLTGKKNVFSYNIVTSIGNGNYGIWIQSPSTTTFTDSNVVIGNKINAGSYGIYIYDNRYAFVANNSIVSGNQGIVNYRGSFQRFYHNTVNAVSYGMFLSYSATSANNEWRNNIITSSGTGYVLRLAANQGTNNTWDYNLYHTNGQDLFFSTTPAPSFTAWQTNGQDNHSIVIPPDFLSVTDLQLTNNCGKQGTPLADVTTDINGNPRIVNPPVIGAYESHNSDNIAIDALINPEPGNLTQGIQDVVVRVKNLGANAINTFNISYVLNNGSVVSQPYTGATLAPCDTVSITFTQQGSFASSNQFTVYTDLPNGTTDTDTKNDTFSRLLESPLNGTYTIGGPGATFQTFNEALTTVTLAGVSGPVVFDVNTGTYNEQLDIITPIPNTSAVNTITFKSVANNADSVKLVYAPDATRAILKLSNTNYFNFKHLTIQDLNPVQSSLSQSAYCVHLVATSSYDSIVYCKIIGNVGVWAANFTGKRNIVGYNEIATNNSAISMTGTSDSTIIEFNNINVTGETGRGIDLSQFSNLAIRNNTINTISQSLVTTSNSGNLEISGNKTKTVTGVGITIDGSVDTTYVFNNELTGNSGILDYYLNNAHYYNNTIRVTNTAITVRYSAWSGHNNTWRNNIITNNSSYNIIDVNNTGTNNSWDYNLYYSFDGGALSANYATLPAWLATGQDSNSVYTDPEFVSATDFDLKGTCVKRGIYLPTISVDINDRTRQNPPIIGAYEKLSDSNNISIDNLIEPIVGNIIAGLQDLKVRVRNTGSNPISSFDISYELNNGSPVTLPWTGTLNPCDTVTVTFTGVNQVTLSGADRIKIYTSQPNATTDNDKTDDTLSLPLYTPLSGTYTIGETGANFVSFSEAVQALVIGGVSGQVVFNVQTGTYTERVVIPAILGASAINTITFQSAANHADSVVLNYTADANSYIVRLHNSNHIHFKYITINSTTTTGRAFQLTGTASYNSITYCKLSAGNAGIYASNLSGGQNAFSNNNITGSATGIYLEGSSTVLTDSNTITGNTIQTITYGLYLYYGSNTLVINNNIVSNNEGIRNYYGSGQHFYHNTIIASTYGIHINYTSATNANNNEWRNNIITCSLTDNAARITNTGANNTWDYNLYHTNGTNLFYNSPTHYAATWQAVNGQDKHSLVYKPAFTPNLQPNAADTASWAINGRAIFLDSAFSALIGTDINGNPRSLKREDGVPDLGAYEFTPTVKPSLAVVIGSLAVDSTQIFLSPVSGDTVARIKWAGVNVPDKIEVRQYVGVAPPSISVPNNFMYFYTDIKDSGSSVYYNYDIDVYYKDIWLGTNPAEQDVRLYKHNSSGWGTPNTSNPAANIFTDTVRNILSGRELIEVSSLFTGTDLSNPLPVQLLSFKASAVKNDVLLTWSTASEINASHFEVERLVNGNQWSVIGKVKAKENSSSINNYQFTDQSPFTPEASGHQSLYYRLRIVDNDGSYEYSKVVSVSREQQAAQSLSVYPNPFNNNVNVEFVSTVEGVANINIIDITGRDVQLNVSQQIIKGNNLLSIDTDKLNKGIYFLSVELNGKKQVVKLVKQ